MKLRTYYVLFLLFELAIFSACRQEASHISSDLVLPETIDFNFHVRPILSDRCYKCHGPDEKTREAGLRLDIEEGAFALIDSGSNGYAIIPGDVDNSRLFHRINSTDPDEQMPPPDSKLTLSQSEIDILRKWIEQGAKWKSHWAFIPPSQPDLPEVSNPNWPKNGIDHFVMNTLDREGLIPSKEGSKEKQLRRLSFDIRGIPPSLEEIDAFVNDNSPNAYEKWVDIFLASSHYGERMALEWLDLARYADSHGYQDDLERTMWPWRDWVIKAFNSNMPYDKFAKWQIAGDLYPDPTYEQILATGFNRNHKITQEVGVVNEEYRVEYVLDRVNTFSTSFLGLTVGCAQCHDHKFDPISQKEFYSLFSFFNNVPENGRVDYGMTIPKPSLPLPDSTIQQQTAYIKGLIQQQEGKVRDYEQTKWAERESNQVVAVSDVVNNSSSLLGLVAHYPFDYIEQETTLEANGARKATIVNGVVQRQGRFSGGLDFNGENYLEIDQIPDLNLGAPFTVSFWLYSIENGAKGTILSSKRPREGLSSEFELNVGNDGIQFYLRRFGATSKNTQSLGVSTTHILPGNEWVHLTLTYDGSNKGAGIKLFLNGEPQELNITTDKLRVAPTIRKPLRLGKRFYKPTYQSNPSSLFRARIDELMLYNQKLSDEEVQKLSAFDPIKSIRNKSIKSEEDQKRLFFHELHHENASYQLMTQWLSEYKYREMRTEHLILKPTMVMADMDTVRPTYILDRGQYSAPTERVYPTTPQHILPFPEDIPTNRLGLANWLFMDEHPLTARVAVNRYWQMIFGRGLVTTPEDFGSQGDLPSHPALLDWLAIEFRQSGWDVKKLLKTMVMSATYRQTVATNEKILKRDPNNMLLARGPQVRLPAELIRDHALSISGLLSNQMGGPSVKPYQPKGLWLQIATGNQELKEYIQDHGPELYRKSMYTFWKRSLPPPSMITFDASTREQCTVERQATSTPMQALVLLNDPQFTEASRLVAQRMLAEGGNNDDEKIQFAFRLATSRVPSKKELRILKQLLKDQKLIFSQEPQKVESLLQIGEYPFDPSLDMAELAAYTIVANTILNLTETMRKG